jgi:hypothetical protein
LPCLSNVVQWSGPPDAKPPNRLRLTCSPFQSPFGSRFPRAAQRCSSTCFNCRGFFEQGPRSKSRRTNHRSPRNRSGSLSTNLQATTLRKLLRSCRLRLRLTGICSSWSNALPSYSRLGSADAYAESTFPAALARLPSALTAHRASRSSGSDGTSRPA